MGINSGFKGLILDSVIKKLNLRGDISLKLMQTVAYADNVALLARSLKALKEIFYKLQNESTLSRTKHKRRKNQIHANKKKGNTRHNTPKN